MAHAAYLVDELVVLFEPFHDTFVTVTLVLPEQLFIPDGQLYYKASLEVVCLRPHYSHRDG